MSDDVKPLTEEEIERYRDQPESPMHWIEYDGRRWLATVDDLRERLAQTERVAVDHRNRAARISDRSFAICEEQRAAKAKWRTQLAEAKSDVAGGDERCARLEAWVTELESQLAEVTRERDEWRESDETKSDLLKAALADRDAVDRLAPGDS